MDDPQMLIWNHPGPTALARPAAVLPWKVNEPTRETEHDHRPPFPYGEAVSRLDEFHKVERLDRLSSG
jgi:hypothetical protein